MQLRLLSADDVYAALPMPQAIDSARIAFASLSAGTVDMPQRTRVTTPAGVTLTMSAYRQGAATLAIKTVSVYGANPARGQPAVTATVLVLDAGTGLPRALLDGTALTTLRTGAAGALAADLLARRSACVVALFGAGVQAHAQLQGVMAVRRIVRVNLLSRTRQSALRLADEISSQPEAPEVMLAQDPKQALADADIVITATDASTALFDGRQLKPGTHVTAVGAFTPQMQEIDAETVARATVVVDSRTACMAEAGDLIIPGAHIDAELGEIVSGTHPGRRSDAEITLFKSVGVAIQDAVAAGRIVHNSEARGLGRMVTL